MVGKGAFHALCRCEHRVCGHQLFRRPRTLLISVLTTPERGEHLGQQYHSDQTALKGPEFRPGPPARRPGLSAACAHADAAGVRRRHGALGKLSERVL